MLLSAVAAAAAPLPPLPSPLSAALSSPPFPEKFTNEDVERNGETPHGTGCKDIPGMWSNYRVKQRHTDKEFLYLYSKISIKTLVIFMLDKGARIIELEMDQRNIT